MIEKIIGCGISHEPDPSYTEPCMHCFKYTKYNLADILTDAGECYIMCPHCGEKMIVHKCNIVLV